MTRKSETEIKELVFKFIDRTLPPSQWDHEAHILVGLWHNQEYDFDTALELVRSRIKAYNLTVGTPNTDDSGYHETITVFWMTLTKAFLKRHPSLSLEEASFTFLNSKLATREYPFHYYSREVLLGKKARKQWIDGDVQSISHIPKRIS